MKPIFKYPELFLIPEVSTLILILLLKNSYKKWKKVAVNAADPMGKGNPTLIVRTLSNTLSFDSKTEFVFVYLPKKVAVIAVDQTSARVSLLRVEIETSQGKF